MSDFRFNPDLAPQDNIEDFFNFLAQSDAGLAQILKANIGLLLPLPDGQQRTTARTQFNQAALESLMQLEGLVEGDR